MKRMKVIGTLLLLIVLTACTKEEIRPVEQPAEPEEVACGCEYTLYPDGVPEDTKDRVLSPEYFSMDRLVNTFVHYLNTGNRKGLESLLVTENEFKSWIFPEYNIANPVCNIEPGMIFRSMQNKSIEGMDLLESDFFFKEYEFVRLEITNAEQEEDFESYDFFNRTLIHVVGPEGPEVLGITGTIVALNNRFKLLTYRENNHTGN